MLEHFEAGDDIEFRSMGFGKCFGSNLQVFDFQSGFEQMQASHFQRRRCKINAGDNRTLARQAFCQDAATAADIQDTQAGERTGMLLDPVEP